MSVRFVKFPAEHIKAYTRMAEGELEVDRSCRFAKDFDELLEQSMTDDLSCLYCTNYVSNDEAQFKFHFHRVHYSFAYCFMLDDRLMWVLACRRKCLDSLRQGNRSHFHCPVCGQKYGRKPGLTHHIQRWKGECKGKETPGKRRVSQKLRTPINQDLDRNPEMKALEYSFETIQAAGFLDNHMHSTKMVNGMDEPYKTDENDHSSYTVVVEKEELDDKEERSADEEETSSKIVEEIARQSMMHSAPSVLMGNTEKRSIGGFFTPQSRKRPWGEVEATETPSQSEDDAVMYFGKTVTSRIHGLSRKKQALAMQKIMQLLFDIEYS